jgi:hypothetical protein
VSFTFVLYFAAVALLLVLLFWALGAPVRHAGGSKDETALLGQMGRRHATYLPLIRQALSPVDIGFMAARGSVKVARRMRQERRGIALSYLTALREDFTRLLRLATVVAALSPEIATAQEAERVWLNAQFAWRYQMLRVALHAGVFPQRRLDALSHMVSELAVRMETTIRELGERAANTAKLASSLDERGVDIA